MSLTLDRINALSEEWHACYREMGALAEGLAVGQAYDEEAEVLLRERLRSINGKLARAWEQRRWERRERWRVSVNTTVRSAGS